ncbi:MAG TPA: hypothetical protein VMT35_05020 [Ignavibacteriaceae bacterium]|nr:hypothetical protein [Ignavibacteriaceae bacterium]
MNTKTKKTVYSFAKRKKKNAPRTVSPAVRQKREAQNQYIETWYTKKTIPQIAGEMKISESTVKYKMRQIGLVKSKRWNKKELEYLKKYYSKKKGNEIAKILGRNKYSIYQKANKLELISSVRIPKSYDKEKKYIQKWYGEKSRKKLAAELKKTVGFVSARINEMKLIKVKKWSKEDLDFLKNNYKTMKFREIAEHLGRKLYGVEKMANRLLLIKRPEGVRRALK